MVGREFIGEFSHRRRGKLKSCSRSFGKKVFGKYLFQVVGKKVG
jgi:hypothetical protein